MFRTSFIPLQGSLRCTCTSAFLLLQKRQKCIYIAAVANKRFLHNNINNNNNNNYCCDNILLKRGSGSAVHPLINTQQCHLHTSTHQHKSSKIPYNNKKGKTAISGKLKSQHYGHPAANKGKNSSKKITQSKKGKRTSVYKSTNGTAAHKKCKHFSTSHVLRRKTALQINQKLHSIKSGSRNKSKQLKKKQSTSQLPSSSHSTKHTTTTNSSHYRRRHSQLRKGKSNKPHANKKAHQHNLLTSSFASQRKHHHAGRPKQSATRRFVKKVAKSFKHAIGQD